jgi:hypothetical protein
MFVNNLRFSATGGTPHNSNGIMPPIKESDTGTGTLPIGMLVNKLLTEQELGRLIEEATIGACPFQARVVGDAVAVEACGRVGTTQTFKQLQT